MTLLLVLATALLGACTGQRSTWSSGGGGGTGGPLTPTTGWATPTDLATPTSAGPSPSPSVSRTTTSPRPPSSPTTRPASSPSVSPTGSYLDRLPSFGPAPTPVPVTLAHAPGRAAWTHEIPTTQQVAFLTIDDGWTKAPEAIALLRASNVPITLFLTTDAVKSNVGYFAQLQSLGAVIEDHTISHPDLTDLSYEEQKHQLCASSDTLGGWYHRRPIFFRPPFGAQNDTTLRAAWDCGLVAGFHWRETVDKGVVSYQRSDHRIHPGDIILMHFRTSYVDDFIAALKAIKASGLTPALLEDYVKVA